MVKFLFLIGKNPKPCLPITQLSNTLTLFFIKVFKILHEACQRINDEVKER